MGLVTHGTDTLDETAYFHWSIHIKPVLTVAMRPWSATVPMVIIYIKPFCQLQVML